MTSDDIIQNTVKAFSVSATAANGYSQGAPTGRYLAPANGPDCIETAATSADGFRLTSLLGDNTSRLAQLVWRVRW